MHSLTVLSRLTSDIDEDVQMFVAVGQCRLLDGIFIEVVYLQNVGTGLFQLVAGKVRCEQIIQSKSPSSFGSIHALWKLGYD